MVPTSLTVLCISVSVKENLIKKVQQQQQKKHPDIYKDSSKNLDIENNIFLTPYLLSLQN